MNYEQLKKEVKENFFVKVHDQQVARRQEQKRDADILKSAKWIYKNSSDDDARNEANCIINLVEKR